MELIILGAVCFAIWKMIDSNTSHSKGSADVTTRTTITDSPKGRTVVTEIEERLHVSGENRTSRSLASSVDLGDHGIVPHRPAIPGSTRVIIHSSPQQERAPVIQDRSPVVGSQEKQMQQSLLTYKACDKCGKTKIEEDFFRSKSGGLTAWCKQCHAESKGSQAGESRHYKVCPKCQSRRLRTNFGKSEKNPDGLTKWCLPCLKKAR